MVSIWARQALLPEGWAQNVTVAIGDDGRISSVSPDTSPRGQVVGVLLPAPVNVHSHAFQRAMAGLTEQRGPNPGDTFWTWRQLMFRFLDRLTPDHVQAIAAFVQMEMLECGYATNAEFHYLHHQPDGDHYDDPAEMSVRIAAAAEQSGIGLCLLPVQYQFGGCDQRSLAAGQVRFGCNPDEFFALHGAARKALTTLPADATLGVAPHSPRAVGIETLKTMSVAFPTGPIHMHIAEQVAEVEEVVEHWGARPVEWVLENMDISHRWCLIHCTQMTPSETKKLAKSGAIAGLCPITESNLGDGIFNGVEWLAHDGKIAIGSDSNIRIALAEELRTLEYSQRLRDRSRAALATLARSAGRRMFEEINAGGAAATGRDSGAIKAGKWADLTALDDTLIDLADLSGDTLLDSWIFASDDRLIADVWSAGRHMVQDGQHVKREAITKAYRKAMSDLRDTI